MAFRMRSVAGLLVALALVSGCAGAGGASALPAGPAATPAPATPAPATPAADPVATAYLRFWDAVVAAHRAADPAAPALAAAAADPQLTRVRQAVARNKVQRLSLRGTVGHRLGPARTSGDTATVEDCYDISAWDPVDVRTGEPVAATEQGGTGRYRARYTLRRAGSGWRVVDQVALGGC